MSRLRIRSLHLLLLVCGALYVAAAAQARTPRGSALAVAVSTIASPVVGTVNATRRAWQSILLGRQDLQRTLADYASLREEVEDLRRTNRLLIAELATLRQGSRLLADLPSLTDRAVVARVIARDILTAHTVHLDRGSVHGVTLDAAVVADSGVLGRVDRVFSSSCRVQLLSHPAAAAAARIAGMDTEALLMGGDQPALTGLPPYREVADGLTVVTTGSEGIYPAGLFLGTTAHARTEGFFTIVDLELAAHPADVNTVLVLPGPTGEVP